MGVLSDSAIRERLKRAGMDRILVEPYPITQREELIQPASLDIRLGPVMKCLFPRRADGSLYPPMEHVFTLYPGHFYLGTTLEYVEIPNDLVARLEGKSSLGRQGLLVHATAGYVDPGFVGELTLELTTFMPITLREGQRIGQLSFHTLEGVVEHPYSGKYQGQKGPTEAR